MLRRVAAVLVALLAIPNAWATHLAALKRGQSVRLMTLGGTRLCEGKVQDRSAEQVTLVLADSSVACEVRGTAVSIQSKRVVEVIPRTTRGIGRMLAKCFLVAGGVAALAVWPLNSSDPESWLILANVVLPAMVAYGAWHAGPDRRAYTLVIACPEQGSCFGD